MLHRFGVIIRTLAIFGFLLTMPVLAIPAVASRVESALGEAPGWIETWIVDVGSEWINLPPPAKSQPSGVAAATEKPTENAPSTNRFPPIPPGFKATPGKETATRTRPDAAGEPDRSVASERQLTALQERLQQFGARNFAWETADDGSCRFRCDVPLANNSVYSKPFVATDVDRQSAMQRVEAAIAAWHRQSTSPRRGDSEVLP